MKLMSGRIYCRKFLKGSIKLQKENIKLMMQNLLRERKKIKNG